MGRRSWGGFTLMELMVVIALIIILAGIMFPVFAQARDAARRARCLSNLHQLSLAHRMYVQDHDDMLPAWYYSGVPGGDVIWPDFLRRYYSSPGILDQGWKSAGEKQAGSWLADYVLCAWGPFGQGTEQSPYWRYPGSIAMAQVRRPAETLQFIDGTTSRSTTRIASRHLKSALNGALADGHVRRFTAKELDHVDYGERGYFYRFAAADR
jgi:type II secretory pathway pseudopilin PulG